MCYDRGTKKKGNVCVHTSIGGEGRGPGEGGEALGEGRPDPAWGMRKHKRIQQVKGDVCWGGQMVCFKMCV